MNLSLTERSLSAKDPSPDKSALLSYNAKGKEGEQELSADAEEDALLFHNWLLVSRQPAINQHLTLRRLEDSGKVCDNISPAKHLK